MDREYTYEDFLEIIKTLRSENGCPWDREQTHESLRPCMMEEAAEVIAAIRIYNQTGNAENLREELGDVLFSVVNVARFLGVDPEEALSESCDKFTSRFSYGESEASKRGKILSEMTLEEMDGIYREGKALSESK